MNCFLKFLTILTIVKTILQTCNIWDTDYNSDNWEPESRQSFRPANKEWHCPDSDEVAKLVLWIAKILVMACLRWQLASRWQHFRLGSCPSASPGTSPSPSCPASSTRPAKVNLASGGSVGVVRKSGISEFPTIGRHRQPAPAPSPVPLLQILSPLFWFQSVLYLVFVQSCKMSRIPRIYPCKKVAKCGKIG